MTRRLFIVVSAISALVVMNCTSMGNKLPTGGAVTNYNLNKSDLTVSAPTTGEASHTYILGINFARLFSGYSGSNGAIVPTLWWDFAGNCVNEARYNAIDKAGEADVLLAPKSKVTVFNLLYLFATAECSVTGRAASIAGTGGAAPAKAEPAAPAKADAKPAKGGKKK